MRLDNDRLLVNRFGSAFATMEPTDLLVIDLDGKIVEGVGKVNQTIILHAHIHRLCPDTGAAIHSHSDAAVSLGCLRVVPEIFDQDSCLMVDGIGLLGKDHRGLDTSASVAETFRDRPQLLSVLAPNHGGFTRGKNIAQATYHAISLELVCRRHLEVHRAGRALDKTPTALPLDAARKIRQEILALDALDAMWEEEMRRLALSDPDLVLQRAKLSAPGWL